MDDAAISNHTKVQHHVGFQPVFPLHHLPQKVHFSRLQLSHIAQAAGVHPQDGDVVGAGEASQMEDGAVTAEANEHIRALRLLVQVFPVKFFGEPEAVVHGEGQAHHGLHAALLQHLFRLAHYGHALIPVRIRT